MGYRSAHRAGKRVASHPGGVGVATTLAAAPVPRSYDPAARPGHDPRPADLLSTPRVHGRCWQGVSKPCSDPWTRAGAGLFMSSGRYCPATAARAGHSQPSQVTICWATTGTGRSLSTATPSSPTPSPAAICRAASRSSSHRSDDPSRRPNGTSGEPGAGTTGTPGSGGGSGNPPAEMPTGRPESTSHLRTVRARSESAHRGQASGAAQPCKPPVAPVGAGYPHVLGSARRIPGPFLVTISPLCYISITSGVPKAQNSSERSPEDSRECGASRLGNCVLTAH
jgi:hypothetical protein